MADIQIVKRDGRWQSYDNKKVAAVVAELRPGLSWMFLLCWTR